MIPGYEKTVEYRIRVDLKAGEQAPSGSDLMACIQVGAEGAPDDVNVGPFLDNLDVLQVDVEGSAGSAVDSLITSYEVALTAHIYDEQNGEKVPSEQWDLVEAARSEIGTLRQAIASLPPADTLYTLDEREHATVLAALRAWQACEFRASLEQLNIASNSGALVPLSESEIDVLCERLNTAPGEREPQFMVQWENAALAEFCTLEDITSANAEGDPELCAWAREAKVGESHVTGGGAAPMVTTWRIS